MDVRQRRGRRRGAVVPRRHRRHVPRGRRAPDGRAPGPSDPDEPPARHDRRGAHAARRARLRHRADRQRDPESGLCGGVPGRDRREDPDRADARELAVGIA